MEEGFVCDAKGFGCDNARQVVSEVLNNWEWRNGQVSQDLEDKSYCVSRVSQNSYRMSLQRP